MVVRLVVDGLVWYGDAGKVIPSSTSIYLHGV